MSMATRATRALDAAGVAYRLHPYDYDAEASTAGGKGLQAAAAVGAPPQRVLKTLMAWVDARPVCVVIPSDRQLHPKALAAAAGGKGAKMMEVAEAERRTGYKVGGISPFGQQRPAPVWIERDAMAADSVFVNAGQRGLLLEISPADAMRVLKAQAVAISR
ncbi:Cys-tRNA(Pro) deacylase [Pseudoxanthomonas broegbernensis]|uniref:Cys-tRNA(Pro)/Cys-tRNA(Cys) deacylase n=1 Tax=Pseudoxanthomonas broegbernensis TaxID=83619 RepID=A0A7V8K6Y0_9GAMM|nr:Cys-tRNA(Pro) deacylase [Pseudoxanthomonas broegbernensis]KAF1686427.1 Cys-tRNA(Pro) deacylase [Pseudoxanthomonas broegbernensis]MBB6064322.1 Cys-tRNA(Pro)/Cys-tRNA(Cys) deacylase [Pseudoxanthomonas broegbernensis]